VSGRLILCPTPIGNLDDITLRTLGALRDADLVACEDTRRTGVLLERHGIAAKRLISYHEHNERARVAELAKLIATGTIVALVSDAGTPLVSDPGWGIVRACLDAGLEVESLPGPSAVLTALVASGIAADRFTYVGFLPRRAGELRKLWRERRETVIAFESPKRLEASLRSLAEVDPDRPAVVCRELTKRHEEVVRGTAAELAARYAGATVRGEIVVVAGPAPGERAPLGPAVDALARLVDAGARRRPAAAVVAQLTGASANELYAALAKGRDG